MSGLRDPLWRFASCCVEATSGVKIPDEGRRSASDEVLVPISRLVILLGMTQFFGGNDIHLVWWRRRDHRTTAAAEHMGGEEQIDAVYQRWYGWGSKPVRTSSRSIIGTRTAPLPDRPLSSEGQKRVTTSPATFPRPHSQSPSANQLAHLITIHSLTRVPDVLGRNRHSKSFFSDPLSIHHPGCAARMAPHALGAPELCSRGCRDFRESSSPEEFHFSSRFHPRRLYNPGTPTTPPTTHLHALSPCTNQTSALSNYTDQPRHHMLYHHSPRTTRPKSNQPRPPLLTRSCPQRPPPPWLLRIPTLSNTPRLHFHVCCVVGMRPRLLDAHEESAPPAAGLAPPLPPDSRIAFFVFPYYRQEMRSHPTDSVSRTGHAR